MVEVLKQNFKNLVLTAPGERVMLPTFGVGIRNFLFEPNISSTYGAISSKIKQQVRQWMPFISIDDMRFETDPVNENLVGIQISYTISPLELSDVLELVI
tara:strand:- start:446 stop:745 length:300 start_codon:yes stop_codon:yes gene_type:complete